MKVKSITVFFILSFISSYAIADETSHKAAAEELILLSNPDQMLEQIWSQVGGMADQQFQQMGAPEELRPTYKKYYDKMFKVMEDELSFENMREDIIGIYVKTYTESEIRAFSEFYNSQAGKVFLKKMPELMQQSMIMSKKRLPQVMQKVQAIYEQMEQEFQSIKDQQQEKQ